MSDLSFAQLFKKYRLKSEFETISEFGDALAEEGYVYENSLFSHWQKGTRIPKDRNLLLTLIQIFSKREGLGTIQEVNLLLESAGMGYLTKNEKKLFDNLIKSSPFYAPIYPPFFTGRDKELKSIRTHMQNKNPVLISGPAGVGKSTFATIIAHQMRYEYPDGVLWAKVDSSSPTNILNIFARAYHEDISYIKDIESKSSFIRSLLLYKKVLIVLDNVIQEKNINNLFFHSSTCQTIITSRIKEFNSIENLQTIELKPFSPNEVFLYFIKRLNRGFVVKHESQFLYVAKLLEYLPLAIALITNQLKTIQEDELKTFVKEIKKNILNYLKDSGIKYDVKNSFEASYNLLREKERQVFLSMAIFNGYDFSHEVITYINQLSQFNLTRIIHNLINYSLVQQTSKDRYKLHPLLKAFAKEKKLLPEYYVRSIEFYLKIYKEYENNQKIDTHQFINREIDNIIGIFDGCVVNNQYTILFDIWEYFWVTLWDYGYWDKAIYYVHLLLKIIKKEGLRKREPKYLIQYLGLLNIYSQKYKTAEEIINRGLRIAIKNKDNLLIALGFARKGLLYRQQNKLRPAINQFNKALTIFEEIKENFRIMNTLYNLAYCYYKEGDYITAKKFILEAIEINKAHNYPRMETILLCVLGMIFFAVNKFHEAKKMFSRSLAITKTSGYISWVYVYDKTMLKMLNYSDSTTLIKASIDMLINQNKSSLLVEKFSDFKQVLIHINHTKQK